MSTSHTRYLTYRNCNSDASLKASAASVLEVTWPKKWLRMGTDHSSWRPESAYGGSAGHRLHPDGKAAELPATTRT